MMMNFAGTRVFLGMSDGKIFQVCIKNDDFCIKNDDF